MFQYGWSVQWERLCLSVSRTPWNILKAKSGLLIAFCFLLRLFYGMREQATVYYPFLLTITFKVMIGSTASFVIYLMLLVPILFIFHSIIYMLVYCFVTHWCETDDIFHLLCFYEIKIIVMLFYQDRCEMWNKRHIFPYKIIYMYNLEIQSCRIYWIHGIRFRRYRVFPRNSTAKHWNSSRHHIILSRNINISVTQTNQEYFYHVLYILF